MNWEGMTPEERDKLIHTEIMKRTQEPCQDGQLDPFMGGYWRCSCGWISDFFIGEGETSHTIPIPRYTQSLDAAWLVLREMVRRMEEDTNTQYFNEVFEAFSDAMFAMAGREATWGDIYPGFRVYIMASQWTPDMICQAALRAVGVAIA